MIRLVVDKKVTPGPTVIGAAEVAAYNEALAAGRRWTVDDHRRFHPEDKADALNEDCRLSAEEL